MDHKTLPRLSAGSLRLMLIVTLLVGLGHIPAAGGATRVLTFVEAEYDGVPEGLDGAESVAVSPDGKHAHKAGTARLTSDQAITMALNDLVAIGDGYCLRHPRHTATFTSAGLEFAPRRGEPAWAWHLTAVTVGDVPLSGATVGAVRPVSDRPGVVAYARGGLTEQYLARKGSLEQQFVIPQPLPLGGADLVIAGAVRSEGVFEATADGWRWYTTEGAVCLGEVRAYDVAGEELPATMQVTATGTRIVVDGTALASAIYPVTIDPEIGANDFRLSDMGPDGDDAYVAQSPAVAYNSTDDEYLVVWSGDDNTAPLVDGEYEIFGQRVDGATGAELGTDFRLSDMGPDGNRDYGAVAPAVAYNGANNEYLVVWSGDDLRGGLFYDGSEIHGQRVNAVTGAEIGTDFRLSDMGPDGREHYSAFWPAIAYNSANNEYLVVWHGDDNTGGLVNGELEIFGQRVSGATGVEIGTDFRLSDMGPDGDVDYNAFGPAVAYNPAGNEYLVVWYGDDNSGTLVDGEFEIFGQRFTANYRLYLPLVVCNANQQ